MDVFREDLEAEQAAILAEKGPRKTFYGGACGGKVHGPALTVEFPKAHRVPAPIFGGLARRGARKLGPSPFPMPKV